MHIFRSLAVERLLGSLYLLASLAVLCPVAGYLSSASAHGLLPDPASSIAIAQDPLNLVQQTLERPIAQNSNEATGPSSHGAEQQTFGIAPIIGKSGEAIPLSISLPDEIDQAYDQARGPVFIMFRNVPSAISFSAGFRLTNSWAVSIKDLDGLSLKSEPTYVASLVLLIILHRGRPHPPLVQQARIHLSREAVDRSDDAIGVLSQPPEQTFSSSTYMPLSPAGVAKQLSRAESLFRAGDLQSARLIYAELADHGIAKAAFLMAQTYDPDVLSGAFIVGLTPNIEKALEWYRKAVELGETEAETRLQVLAHQ